MFSNNSTYLYINNIFWKTNMEKILLKCEIC